MRPWVASGGGLGVQMSLSLACASGISINAQQTMLRSSSLMFPTRYSGSDKMENVWQCWSEKGCLMPMSSEQKTFLSVLVRTINEQWLFCLRFFNPFYVIRSVHALSMDMLIPVSPYTKSSMKITQVARLLSRKCLPGLMLASFPSHLNSNALLIFYMPGYHYTTWHGQKVTG